MKNKLWDVVTAIEAVFGKFGKTEQAQSTKRRCHWCRRKYDMEKVKIDGGTDRFCSQYCADNGYGYAENTRQIRRAACRADAKNVIAHKMGSGPAAANPRRARRKAVLSLARKMYRGVA